MNEEANLLYELEAVSKQFGEGAGQVIALDRVDLTVEAGEFLAVAGPSGSGKSTLLLLLGALDRPSSGWLRFDGRDLGELPDSELARLRLRALVVLLQAVYPDP